MKSLKMQKNKPWPLVMGVDVSPKNLKYVILSRKGKSLLIEGFGKHAYRDGDPVDVQRIWKQINEQILKRRKGASKPEVVLGIEGSGIILKKESLPALSRKEMMQTLKFSMAKEVGTDESDGIIVEYEKLAQADEDDKGNVQYLTLGVAEPTVHEKLNPLLQHGTMPGKIVPVIRSMKNLVDAIPDLKKKKCVALLDIGSQHSVFVIFKNGELDFHREVMVGGGDFTRAITGVIFHEGKAIQYSNDEAEEFKNQFGYPLGYADGMSFRGAPLSEVGTMMRPVVERLTGEVSRSIDFYKEQNQAVEIESVYVMGGGAQLICLTKVLSERIQLPVAVLPLIPGLKFTDRKAFSHFKKHYLEQAVSVALALEESGGINLLPPVLVKEQKQKALMKSLRGCALAVAAALVLFSINTFEKITDVNSEVSNVQKRVTRIGNTGKIFTARVNEKTELESRLVSLNNTIGQDKRMINVLKAVSHSIPDNITLSYLKYGRQIQEPVKKSNKNDQDDIPDKWVLVMRALNRRPPNDLGIFIARFMVDLEKTGYFSGVTLANEADNKVNNEYWFEIVATVDNGEKSAEE